MNKVIWSEGMFLRPQHFQQQDRFIGNQILSRVQYLFPFAWGVSHLELDLSLLSVGKLSVSAIEGVFPDGTLFNNRNNLTTPLVIQLDKSHERQTIFLAVPASVDGVVDSFDDAEDNANAIDTRYRVIQKDVRDSHGVNNRRVYPISTGVLNVMLVAEDQLDDSLISIPIARIDTVSSEGEASVDRRFSGPVLDLAVSKQCFLSLVDLVDLVTTKAKQLASKIESGAGLGSGTIVDLLMLKALNTWGAELSVMVSQSPLHPYDLFRQLVSFTAEISTYSHDQRLPTFDVNYRHLDSSVIITELIEHARALVSTAFKSTAMSLPIQRKNFGISVIGLPSQALEDASELILAVKADLSSDDIRHIVSSKIKVGSVENIKNLVNLQLPGCTKDALPVTPRQVPYHAGMNYFRLSPDAEMKASIQRSSGLGVHVSGDVPGIEFECWVIPRHTK